MSLEFSQKSPIIHHCANDGEVFLVTINSIIIVITYRSGLSVNNGNEVSLIVDNAV